MVKPIYTPSALFVSATAERISALLPGNSLKTMDNPALFQNLISCMTGLDFAIDRHMAASNWTIPNVMITFTAPHEIATIVF
jgi:hypothetical protein